MKPYLNVKIIKDWLDKNDRSIAWLAREIGVNEATMYLRIENRSPLDLDKIAGVLGVKDIKDLVEVGE